MRALTGFSWLTAFLLTAIAFRAAADSKRFEQILVEAAGKSTLTAAGLPFHLKLVAKEKYRKDPQYEGEIEVWWAAPDKWRREIKSPVFSQTAVRNSEHYYESNSSDYLPFWLHEIIQASLDPVPVEDLKNENVEFNRSDCAEWQTS